MEKEGIVFHTNTDIGAPNSPLETLSTRMILSS